jgi:hypothetical protein
MTPSERRVWDAFPEGRWADLRTGVDDEDDPAAGGRWGPERSVRAAVVAGLLLGSNDRRAPAVAALRLAGARITGRLDLDEAEVRNPLRLEGCWFEEAVNLDGASTRTVRLTGSWLPGLDARAARIDGHLDLRQAVLTGDPLRLVNAHITGEVDLSGAVLSPSGDTALWAADVVVDGAVLCQDGFTARGAIRMVGAQLGVGLFLHGARLDAPAGEALILDNAVVANLVCAEGFTAEAPIRLRNARISGQLSFDGANLNGTPTALDCARVQAGDFDLTLAAAPAGAVDLRGAYVRVLHDQLATWPKTVRLDGFVYEFLQSDDDARAGAVSSRIAWIRRSPGYAPQPYEQLAAWYRRVGHDDDARTVLLAKQRHRRATLRPTGRAWGHLLDATVGYGYRPWLAALWLAALTALGTAVFSIAHAPKPVQPGQGQPFQPLIYTLDLLIPIGGLGQRTAWYWTSSGTRWLAYILIAAGWVLTTAVVAGVSRTLNKG